jgi:hypothetical protein
MDLTNKQLNLRNAKERTVIIRRDRQHRESIVGDIKVSIRGRQIRILSIVVGVLACYFRRLRPLAGPPFKFFSRGLFFSIYCPFLFLSFLICTYTLL